MHKKQNEKSSENLKIIKEEIPIEQIDESTSIVDTRTPDEKLKAEFEVFIKDPKNIEVNRSTAAYIEKRMGSKFFTARELSNTIRIPEQQAVDNLINLGWFGFAAARLRGQFFDKKTTFKITLTYSDRIKVIEEDIKYHENQISNLKMKLNGLED
jgi:hypothetical protein